MTTEEKSLLPNIDKHCQATRRAQRLNALRPGSYKHRLTAGDAIMVCLGNFRAGHCGQIVQDDGPGFDMPYRVRLADGQTGSYGEHQIVPVLSRRLTTGDKVVISTGSRKNQQGRIVKDDGPCDPKPYKVRFPNGDEVWVAAKEAISEELHAAVVGGLESCEELFGLDGEITDVFAALNLAATVASEVSGRDTEQKIGRAVTRMGGKIAVGVAVEAVAELTAGTCISAVGTALVGAEAGLILGPFGVVLGLVAGALFG